jgi:hypothetical protein
MQNWAAAGARHESLAMRLLELAMVPLTGLLKQ